MNGGQPGRAGSRRRIRPWPPRGPEDTLVHATLPMAAAGPLDPAVRRVLDYLTGQVLDMEEAGDATMVDQSDMLRALGLRVPPWSAVGRITGRAARALRAPPYVRPGRPR